MKTIKTGKVLVALFLSLILLCNLTDIAQANGKGGADEPYNMQLLPKETHKQKTKMERKQ